MKIIYINKTNFKNKIIHDNKMKIIRINKTDLKNKITHIKHITKTKIKHNLIKLPQQQLKLNLFPNRKLN